MPLPTQQTHALDILQQPMPKVLIFGLAAIDGSSRIIFLVDVSASGNPPVALIYKDVTKSVTRYYIYREGLPVPATAEAQAEYINRWMNEQVDEIPSLPDFPDASHKLEI